MNVTTPTPSDPRTRRTRLLLRCGVAVAPLFLAVAVAQVLTRSGFDITQHAVSSLQNGALGWVQSTNFVVCGLLSLLCARGIRQHLCGARGGTWAPMLVGAFGVGMILAGIFPPDPAFGFPAGAPEGAPEVMSTSGILHSLGFFGAFLSLIAACFVMARHFGCAMSRWRSFCLVSGVGTPALIVLGSSVFSDASGVFFFAAGALSFTWLSAVAGRLSAETTPGAGSQPRPVLGAQA